MTTTNQDMAQAVQNFIDAAIEVSKIWEAKYTSEDFIEGYPFHISFDDLLCEIMEWRDRNHRLMCAHVHSKWVFGPSRAVQVCQGCHEILSTVQRRERCQSTD